MRFIPTKIHGVLDYVVGIVLIIAPFVFGFYRGGAESWVPIILGVATLVYSLITNYELGAAKVVPMRAHLTLDFISGVVLLVSPWLFRFADVVWVPHVIVGLLEIGVALTTHTIPYQTAATDVHGISGTPRSGHI